MTKPILARSGVARTFSPRVNGDEENVAQTFSPRVNGNDANPARTKSPRYTRLLPTKKAPARGPELLVIPGKGAGYCSTTLRVRTSLPACTRRV